MNIFTSIQQAVASSLADPNAYHDKFPEVPDISGNDLGAPLTSLAVKPYGILARAALAYYSNYQMAYVTSEVGADSSLPSLWADTRKLGIRMGPYAYILQNKIQVQADCFIKAVKDCGMWKDGQYLAEFPPCADVEAEVPAALKKPPKNYVEPIRGAAWANQIKEWLDRVETALGVIPMIYTAQPQWNYLLTDGKAPSWTPRHLLWAKFYPYLNSIDSNTSFPAKMLPTGFTLDQLIFWQYFDKGRTYGRKFNDQNAITLIGQKLFDAKVPGVIVPPVIPPIIPIPETDYVTSISMIEHYKSGVIKNVEIQL